MLISNVRDKMKIIDKRLMQKKNKDRKEQGGTEAIVKG